MNSTAIAAPTEAARVLNDSAAWTEEIAHYFLIGTVFIGAAVGVRKALYERVQIIK